MKISVVLNLLNEKRHIRDLLDSLIVQESPVEIVAVDAGSQDGTVEVIKTYAKKHDNIRYHYCPGTRGESTNYGISVATGDAIATIGGDCIANPFWVGELRRSLQNGDVVAGKTINIGYHAFEDLDRVELYHRGVDVSHPSASMAWNRKVLEDVGGFDPWFVTAEDIDVNLRAVEKGYKMVVNEEAIVYHRTKGSFRGFFKQAFWNGWGRKQLTMKHGNLWQSYKPTRLIETSKSMWAISRLCMAVLGYLMCKAFERLPEGFEQSHRLAAVTSRKRWRFLFPGR
ncbi:MAG: glycosyltransferase [Methanobacteriota archaeon]|nr:MAG: glycosyltransferase [Euryarchaeota archaeon]